MDEVWIDVQMWTALRGNFHQFMDVKCDVPVPQAEPAADDVDSWRARAVATLTQLAADDGWQAGRYAYTVERRDEAGRAREVFVQGVVDLNPPSE